MEPPLIGYINKYIYIVNQGGFELNMEQPLIGNLYIYIYIVRHAIPFPMKNVTTAEESLIYITIPVYK